VARSIHPKSEVGTTRARLCLLIVVSVIAVFLGLGAFRRPWKIDAFQQPPVASEPVNQEPLEILSWAKRLCVPREDYQVIVEQRLLTPKDKVHSTEARLVRFPASFSPDRGLRPAYPQEPSREAKEPTVRITVDIKVFIDEMLRMDRLEAAAAECHKHNCYRLEGVSSGGKQRCVLWIDTLVGCVRRAEVYLWDKPFADIDFEYKDRQHGCWLPSRLEVHHPNDGTTAVQEFVAYTFQD
jgi:hypothetical protein